MRRVGPFGPQDLDELGHLYQRADRVIPTRDVWKGDTSPNAISVRHDVDDNPGSFDTALAMAEWEFEHGWSTTYFLLHTAAYYTTDNLVRALAFEELGHEVGLHVNALAEGLRTNRDPEWLLLKALGDLRAVGIRVDGCVAHGDPLCRNKAGNVVFTNDEIFEESARPTLGAPDRFLSFGDTMIRIEPQPRATYHLHYDAAWLSRGDYLSDSGHVWSQPFDTVAAEWPHRGQLHILCHPDWWLPAFSVRKVAA